MEHHITTFIESNPQLKNINTLNQETKDLLLWADKEKHIVLTRFLTEVFYDLVQIEQATIWAEKCGYYLEK